jgi:hypothetical protein
MKIFTGDFEIFSAGEICSDGLNSIKFSLLESPRFDVVFRVEYNGKESSVEYKLTGEGEVTFIFYNPDVLGFGIAAPVKIGFLENRELFVTFSTNMRGSNDSFTLNYTFYLKVAK